MASTLDQLMQSFQKSADTAKAANLKRYNQAMNIYDAVISNYSPGGAFEKATLSGLEKQKTRDVGKETHDLISSGLFGTTTQAATGRKWEEAVGSPSRLKMEDIQMQRMSDAQLGKASFLSSAEDVGPDLGLMAQLFSQAGNRPTGPGYTEPKTQLRTYGRTYGASSFPDMFSIGGGGARRTGGTGQRVTRESTGLSSKQPAQSTDWEAKRLADEAANKRLLAEGQLNFTPTQQSGEDKITQSFLATGKWKMSPNGQLVRK